MRSNARQLERDARVKRKGGDPNLCPVKLPEKDSKKYFDNDSLTRLRAVSPVYATNILPIFIF